MNMKVFDIRDRRSLSVEAAMDFLEGIFGMERRREAMERFSDEWGDSEELRDNAVAENFFCCLKGELVHLTHYPSRAKARADVFAYIEGFYNTLRPHSALGWIPPERFEANLNLSAA